MEEKIDLMARYLVARNWSMWTSEDPELNQLHDLELRVARENRHLSNIESALAAKRAVLNKVFGYEP